MGLTSSLSTWRQWKLWRIRGQKLIGQSKLEISWLPFSAFNSKSGTQNQRTGAYKYHSAYNRELSSKLAFKAWVENARQIYLTWFSTFWKEGRYAARVCLRKSIWKTSSHDLEERLVKARIRTYDELIATLDDDDDLLYRDYQARTFSSFSKLPMEYRPGFLTISTV